MANVKIRIKPPHAIGSLATRAVIVSLFLLVVPLFLHSLFLYWQEYKTTLSDVKENLELTARGQRAVLEERIHLEWQILDAVDLSDLKILQKLGVVEISMPVGVSDHFIVPNLHKDAFYIGKKMSDSRAFAMLNPIDEIFKDLVGLEIASYSLSLSFIDRQENVLFGVKEKTDLSVQLPVTGANFFLSLSIPVGAVEKLHKQWYVYHYLSLLFFVGVVGGGFVWLITQRIARPLQQLCKAMGKVGEGALHVRYIPDRMGFEINELGKQFNQTLDQLLENGLRAEKEKIARERLAQELKIGHDIQASLLPKHLPDFKGLEIASGFLPATEVGGDFYDLFRLEDGRLLIAIADTAGKGISACLYSLGLRSMLRALASNEATLSEIVLRANDLFWKDARQEGMFVTLWIGLYDPDTQVLEYCSQGHPPAYWIHKNKASTLWTPGIALGAQAFDAVTVKQQKMEPEDLLFLYTDGIVESHNVEGKLYGSKRLHEFLLDSGTFSPQKLSERLVEQLSEFSRGVPQHDDMTWLAIRVH